MDISACSHAGDLSEQEVLRRWQQDRKSADLQALITRYMPKIRAWSRRGGARHVEDLVAEGIIALIEAADRYVVGEGQGFGGFAMPAVRGAIYSALARQDSAVSIPERQLRDAVSGRMPVEKADMIRQALQVEDFDEFTVAQSVPAAEEETLRRERRRLLRKAVAGALRPLGRQERRLIVHHLLKEDMALETVAGKLSLSVSRARMIEGRALHKMRNTLMNEGFLVSDLA